MSDELKELIEQVDKLERILDRMEKRHRMIEFIDARPWYPLWIPTTPPKWHNPIIYRDNTSWGQRNTSPQSLTNGTYW